ncbi:hypothetical protein [Ancylomarina sp. 16SWW S1-10-2]|uniref:hypothetical protein n=1 Tax=Ancylomarina sp. 16SWW S1-10-2 TaxID=2499681 RepID=UPI0012AE7623|nr:hypothetical protein [Ancylomarina sp. 16SWW S1-10-2]MRT93139.1 hypothetical protein [Ancylomarina sp. 16SWW S1-10-2]
MKNRFKYLTLAVLISVFASCDKDDSPDDKNIKRYNVESGIIEFTTTTSGTIGTGTITGSGTDQLYFEKWGALELANEESTTTTVVVNPISGETITKTDIIHSTVKIDNEMIYTVDYDSQRIYTQQDPLIELMRLNDYDALEAGRKTLISMGGEQLDNEEFKGYDCEVWFVLGATQWMYKGITLKIITKLGGITITKEATDIKFNVPVNDSYFELPEYKTTSING